MRLRTRILLASVLISILLLSGALLFSVERTLQRERATRALVKAVDDDNTAAALTALSEGADPNVTDADPPLPLTFWQTVLTLVHPPRSPQTTTDILDQREPLLMTAAMNQNEAIVTSLLQHGANVNATDHLNETALHIAALGETPIPRNGGAKSRMMTALLAYGANVNAHGRRGATPLMDASERDDPPALTLLLAHGAQINARDNDGQTALWYSVRWGSVSDVALLLQAGAEVNARDEGGCTALWEVEYREADPRGTADVAYRQDAAAVIALLKRAGGHL